MYNNEIAKKRPCKRDNLAVFGSVRMFMFGMLNGVALFQYLLLSPVQPNIPLYKANGIQCTRCNWWKIHVHLFTHTLAQSYIGISIPHTYTHVVDFYVFPYFYVCIVPLTSFGLCKSAYTFSLERGCSAVCCVYVAEVHMRLS